MKNMMKINSSLKFYVCHSNKFREPVKNVRCYTASSSYEFIKTDKLGEKGNVALITLNRPKALNSLCNGLMNELILALSKFDNDKSIGAIVLTGNDKAFAAGGDLREVPNKTYASCFMDNFMNDWERGVICKKPLIAATNGFVLGSGYCLALMCDIIYAGENACFGVPEIGLGTVAAGVCQRLTRIAGKSKAMEICLTGNTFNAVEAERMGVVSKIFPVNQLIIETIKLGEKISNHSPLTVQLMKDCVNTAYETTLNDGLKFERRINHATFLTKDCAEGVTAFIEKRPAKFLGE